MIAFPTIRHTGSHFVVGLFGFDINQAMSWKHPGSGEYYFDHIHASLKQPMLRVLEGKDIVIPLRHPKVTAKSWNDRGKDEQEMIDAWDCLVNDIDPLGPYYLPLDSEKRDACLQQINEGLGLRLHTLWQPAGVKQNNQRLRHSDVSASPGVTALCNRIKPFLDRFY